MKNTNYKYNPNTLNYEKINLTLWDKFKRLSYYLIASVVVSVLILSFSFYNIKSFIQKEAAKENQSLRQEISVCNKDLNLILEVLNDIQNKDDNIYRAIFEADPYPDHKRKLGTGGNPIKFKKYENIEYGELVVEIVQKLELIEKKLSSQSKSFDEVFEILETEKSEDLFGIFHCFTGNKEQAKQAISYNMKLGIGGVVTYKNGNIDKFLSQIDLSHIVLETDAPYLSPVPFRGKRNESAHLLHIVEKVADIYGKEKEEISEITTNNAIEIFNI